MAQFSDTPVGGTVEVPANDTKTVRKEVDAGQNLNLWRVQAVTNVSAGDVFARAYVQEGETGSASNVLRLASGGDGVRDDTFPIAVSIYPWRVTADIEAEADDRVVFELKNTTGAEVKVWVVAGPTSVDTGEVQA